MKRFPSFSRTIKRILSQPFIFLVLFVCSCEKDRYERPMGTYFEIRNLITQASLENLTVNTLDLKDKEYSVSFSDGGILVIPKDSVTVLTIDYTGHWNVNQENGVWISTLHDALESLLFNTRIVFVEGYTDWTVYFSDDYPVVFTKSLFSFDADAIVKGVNHRGYNIEAPENTLPAFRLSKLHGFNYVETDIRFTSDGIPVLLHDDSIDRTSNGQGKIKDMSIEEVRSFDFGNWKDSSFKGTQIPTLEEFLSLCTEIGLSPHLELKAGSKNQVFQVIDLVEHFGMTENVTYTSFSSDFLKYVLERTPDACVGVLTGSVNESVITNACSLSTDYNHVYIGASDYSETAISLCKQAGLPLSVWVVDSKERILNLPKYVSSVTSNYLHAGRVLFEAGQVR